MALFTRFFRSTPVLAGSSVALTTALLLGLGIDSAALTAPFSDPISGVRAQDEAMYANAGARMAGSGEWGTPKFLGRFLLYKPPLLIWLSAASVKVFGAERWAFRLPVLIAAVLATTVLFLCCYRIHSLPAAVVAFLLLVSNSLWHIYARLCYTDMLWIASTVCALAPVIMDSALKHRRSVWLFGTGLGLGVMAKSVAGLLPLLVVLLGNVFVAREFRTPLRQLLRAATVAAVVCAPWHLYQIIAHPHWFWADYVDVQLLGFGFSPPAQSSQESSAVFYLKRLFLTDPVLSVLAVAGLWVSMRGTIRRERIPSLLSAWTILGFALLATFRYRNLPYALMMVPPLALLGSLCVAGWADSQRRVRLAIAALALVFAFKALSPSAAWGLNRGQWPPLPAAAALDSYARLRRPNDLVLAGAADQFYSATIGLPRVRYYFVDPDGVVMKYAPHYARLGITLTVDQVERLEELQPQYQRSLGEWGLDSAEPVGTAITSRNADGLGRLLSIRPDWDLVAETREIEALPPLVLREREVVKLPNGYVAALARTGAGTASSSSAARF